MFECEILIIRVSSINNEKKKHNLYFTNYFGN